MSLNPLKSFLAVKRKELPFVLLMFSYFFLVIGIFWILKPIKKALLVGFYETQSFDFLWWSLREADVEQVAKLGNIVLAYIAVVVFTMLSNRLRRHQLTLIFSGFSLLSLLCFLPLIGSAGAGTAWAFYLFGDLFNTLMVATFFAFLNDSVAPEAAKRIYGPIVLGGVTGGAVFSVGGRALIDTFDWHSWLVISAGLVVVIGVIALIAGRLVDRHLAPPPPSSAEEPVVEQGNPLTEAARVVFRSRYLLAIVTIVGLYEIVSTILDYQFTSTTAHYLAGDDFDRHFRSTYAITNTLALVVQIFLTSFIMSRVSVRAALLVMPLVILGNSGLFLALPLLWIGSGLSITDNSLNYSLNQSAREALYTPATRDQKYKAKAFIDMLVQRAAKGIAIAVNLGLAAYFGGFGAQRWLSLIVIALVGIWVFAASYAGKRFREMTGDPPPGTPSASRTGERKTAPAADVDVTSSGAFPKPARFEGLAGGHSIG